MKKSTSLSRTKSLLSAGLPARRAQGLAVIAAFVLVGIFVLVYTHAATNPSSMEAEKGTLANGATVINDGNASDGQGVQFGSLPSTTPAPTNTIPFKSSDPQTGVTKGNFYVTNDTWNIGSGGAQTLYVCDYNNWYVMATEPNTTSVKTYPNVHQDFNEPLVTSYHNITSTYAETSPHTGIYEWAYDMWLNGVADNNSTEVMIWNDNFHQAPAGSKRGTFSSSGITYDVYSDGTSCASNGCYIAFVPQSGNTTSGTVDILAFYNYLINTVHYLNTSTTIGQIDYGVEICSTNATPTKFELNNFSLTAN